MATLLEYLESRAKTDAEQQHEIVDELQSENEALKAKLAELGYTVDENGNIVDIEGEGDNGNNI